MTNKVDETFDVWGKDGRANNMADEHWPMVKQAFDLIPPSPGDYLEIGVGNGYAIRHMATHQFAQGRCLGLDVSSKMAELAAERCADLNNVMVKNADFLTWDFAGLENFSLIFSMEVFYYFPDIQKGIDRAYSLLKPGGQLWVLVDYYEENGGTHDWPEKYDLPPIHRWSEQAYRESFRKAGFSKIKQRHFPYPDSDELSSGPGTLCTSGVQ